MNEFTYSFIIPHKNCPDLLQRCVDSIPERDDIQIIVVDDNSDADKKPQLSRKDVEVILLDAEHSKGAGRARNVGLQHAKGKWLLFADADDYYAENFLSVLDSYVDKRFDVLYFTFLHKDGTSGEDLAPLWFQKFIVEYKGCQEEEKKVKYLDNVPWTKMISHDFVKSYGFYFEETQNGNDIFFSMCVGYHAKSIFVEKKPVYVYLRNKNSILTSKESIPSALCRLEHLIKKNQFVKFVGLENCKKSLLKRILTKCRTLGILFLVAVLKDSYRLYTARNEWVVSIPKLTSK